MGMPRTYVAHDDYYDEEMNRHLQGREVCLDHSYEDLLVHWYAGVVAVVVSVLMVVAVVGVVVS